MDIYDQAVEYLSKRVHEDEGDMAAILEAWFSPSTKRGGILFEFAGNRVQNGYIGCLTQIRSDSSKIAATPELTERIRADERLPTSGEYITVDMLPVFAEWQRKIDAELGRSAPEKI